MPHERKRANLLLLALLLLLWSANFIFAKLAARAMPLERVIGWRYLLAGLLIVLYYRFRRPAEGLPRSPRDLAVLLGVGVFGLVGNQVLFVASLSRTSVTHGAVICALSPMLVLIGAALLGQERITPHRAAGMLAAVAGIVLLQLGREPAGSATLSGDLLMFASAVIFAAFNVFGKPVAIRYGSLVFNTLSYAAAGVLAVPVLVCSTQAGRPSGGGAWAWIGIVYMAAATSVAGYLIYASALRRMPASRVATVVYLQPVLAIALAMLIFGEPLRPSFLAASALVFGGVWMVHRH